MRPYEQRRSRADLLASPLERLAEAVLEGRVVLEVTERTGTGRPHAVRVVVEPREEAR